MKQFTALGCHIYAGGFSLGIKQAGFKLLGHLEEWPFGVATAKHNLQIPVWQGLETWDNAITKLSGKVDLLYGNPPCASWSIAGVKKGILETERWKDHGLTDCTKRLFALIPKLRPRVFVWECVSNVVTKGNIFLEERTKEVLSQEYHVYHILFDAMNCGLPQRRRRFYFIASMIELNLQAPTLSTVTVGEAWKNIKDPGPYLNVNAGCIRVLKQMPLNKEMKLYKQFDLNNPNPIRNEQGQCIGRPGFLNQRLSFDHPACTITGGACYFHPIEIRSLSVLEQQVLCGYPLDYQFIGPLSEQYAQIGKGVTTPAAFWLASQLKTALIKNQKIKPGVSKHIFLDKLPSTLKVKKIYPLAFPVLSKKSPRGLGIGLFIRQRLTEGIEPSTILAEVHKKFPTSKATLGDISWNKRKLELTQPIRRPGKIRPEREFDKTQLRAKGHGRRISRDYAAHFFRWGFIKRLVDKETKILDVGCGQDKPLVSVLSDYVSNIPKLYVGVDLNKLPDTGKRTWAHYHEGFNFITYWQELIKTYGTFSVVVCFEVLEHMEKKNGLKLLKALKNCCQEDGTVILSTPVFNGKAARNHLHEWTIPELQEALINAGFIIIGRFGTFASHHDLKFVLTTSEKTVYEALKSYYDNDVTACFLAPLHPDQSRNNVWLCQKPVLGYKPHKH